MKSLRVLVTCGPTRESVDPVRFLSNRSTGVFGLRIAEAFKRRGCRVTVACGPGVMPSGRGFETLRFETAVDLLRLLKRRIGRCDVLVMAAAVSDFRAARICADKIKRGVPVSLRLLPNPDVIRSLSGLKKKRTFIGFAVESSEIQKRAEAKLKKKNLDMILAQKVSRKANPFGERPVDTWLIRRDGTRRVFRRMPKSRIAEALAGEVAGGSGRGRCGR